LLLTMEKNAAKLLPLSHNASTAARENDSWTPRATHAAPSRPVLIVFRHIQGIMMV